MKKKIVSLMLVASITAGLLAGCGGKKEENKTDSTAPAQSTEDTGAAQTDKGASAGVQVVDFWSAPNQQQYTYWSEKAAAFNETKTQVNGKVVEVQVQQMPESPSSEAGIQTAISTGTVPAVSENINRGFAATLADSGVIYDIQDEEWFKQIVTNRAMDTAIAGWDIGGKQYVIPIYINPMAFQWNVKALKALGFDAPPTTQAEYEAVIQAFVAEKDGAMKELGVTHTFYRPSLLRADQWWERWYDFQMVYQSYNGGGNWVEGNKLTLNEENVVKAFEFIGMLGNTIMTGEINPLWTGDQVPVLFSINAPWEISQYAEVGMEYGVDYVYGPTIVEKAGDTAYSYADSKGLVFYKHNSISQEEHDGAVAFVSWVYNEENSAEADLGWLNATNMMPVRGDLAENETFAAKMEELPALKGLADYIPNAIPSMSHSKMTEIQTALTEVGLAPYMDEVMSAEPLNAPDAAPYVSAAMQAMKDAGGLE